MKQKHKEPLIVCVAVSALVAAGVTCAVLVARQRLTRLACLAAGESAYEHKHKRRR